MDKSSIEYFNSLIQQTENEVKEKNMARAIQRKRKISTIFNKYLSCSADFLQTDYRNPLSLKNLTLSYLHVNMAYKSLVKTKQGFFVDYRRAPDTIHALNLPICLKMDLLRMYVRCPKHCLLAAHCPNIVRTVRYILKPYSCLYEMLQHSPNWKTEDNYTIFSLPELVNLLYKCNFMVNRSLSQLLRFIDLNCHKISS